MAKKVLINPTLENTPDLVSTKQNNLSNNIETVKTSGAVNLSPDDIEYVDLKQYSPFYQNFDEIKGWEQSGGDKFSRAFQNSLATAGATFVDTFAGTLGGIINLATGGANGKMDFNDFVNNPISVNIQEWLDSVKKDNQLYATEDERKSREENFLTGLGTANFWAEQLENAGFLVGAAASGYATSLIGSSLLGINKLATNSKLIEALAKIDAIGDAGLKTITKQQLALLKTAGVADEIIETAKKLKYANAGNTIASSVLGSFGEARIEALNNAKDFKESQLNLLQQKYGENIPAEILSKLDEDTSKLENSIFLWNTALLSASNYTQFKGLFSNSNKLNKAIQSDITKNGEQYAVRSMNKAEKFARNANAILKNPLSEMTEEQLQYAVSEGNKDYFDLANNPDSKKSVMNSIAKGLYDAYGTNAGWENAFSGLLMGSLGLAVPSRIRKENGQRAFKWEFGGLKDYKEEQKATKSLVDKANQYATDSAFKKLFDSQVVDETLERVKQEAVNNEDTVSEKTINAQQLANMVSVYSDLGRLDELKGKLNDMQEVINEGDANSLRNILAYKTIETLPDGTKKEKLQDSFKDLSDEELLKKFKNSLDKRTTRIDEYNTLYNSVNNRFSNYSEDARKSLFLNLIEQKDLTKRGNSLYNSILTKTMQQALVQNADVIKRDNLKVSDEELTTLENNWTNAVDIEGFTQYLTREKEATSFIKAVSQYAIKNPDDINVLQDAKDLIKIARTKEYVNTLYNKMVTGQEAVEEERTIKAGKVNQAQKFQDEINGQLPEVKNFYEDNTITDDEGFTSSDIQITDEEGQPITTYEFNQNNPSKLYNKATKQEGYNTYNFLQDLKTDEKGRYISLPNNKKGYVNFVSPQAKRYNTKKEQVEKAYKARISSLRKLLSERVQEANEASETKKIQELNKELKELAKEYKAIEKEISDREAAKRGTKRLWKKLIDLYDKAQTLKSEREETYKELQENNAGLLFDIDVLTRNLNDAKQKLSGLKNGNINFNNINELSAFGDIENKIQLNQEKVNQRIAEFQENVERIEKEKSFLNNLFGFNQATLEKVRDEITKLNDLIDVCKKSIRSLVNEINKKYPSLSTDKINRILSEDKKLNYGEAETLNKLLDDLEVYEDTLQTAIEDLTKLKSLENAFEITGYNTELYNQNVKKLLGNNIFEQQLNAYEKELSLYNTPIQSEKLSESSSILTDSEQSPYYDIESSKLVFSKVGFGTTGGSHTKYKEGKNDELNDKESQKRFFAFTSQLFNPESYKLMAITINHPIYGLGKEKDIFKEDDKKYHTIENIKTIVVNSNNLDAVEFAGDIVYTSLNEILKDPSKPLTYDNLKLETSQGESKYVLDDVSKEEILKQASEILEARKQIQDNSDKTFYFKINGISNGKVVIDKSYVKGQVGFPVLGRLENNSANLKFLRLEVSNGTITDNLGMSYNIPKGAVVAHYNKKIVRLIPRKLNTREINNVINGIKAVIKNIENNKQNPFELGSGDSLMSLTSYLNRFVYSGVVKDNNGNIITDRINYDNLFYFDYKSKALAFGNKVIELNSNTFNNIQEELIKFLENKIHNVHSKILRSEGKYVDYNINNKGELIKNSEYANYKEYLLIEKEGEVPVLTTAIVPNTIGSSNETILDTPQIQGSYLKFDVASLSETPNEKKKYTESEEKVAGVNIPVVDKENNLATPEDFGFNKEVVSSLASFGLNVPVLDSVPNESTGESKSTINLNNLLTGENVETPAKPSAEDNPLKLFSKEELEKRKSTYEKEKARITDMLPEEISIEQVEGLIDSNAVGAISDGAKILISNLATEGVGYHEAFHAVSNFVLTKEERRNLYNEWKTKNNKPEATDLQAEEGLAEDFREFALLNESKPKTAFQKILDFIKGLLGILDNSTINSVFENMINNKYKDAKVLTTSLDKTLYSKPLKIDLNESQIRDYVMHMNLLFFDELFNRGNFKELNTNLNSREIYKKVLEKVLNNFKNSTTNNDKVNNYNIIENHKQLINRHGEYLKSIGIEFSELSEEEDLVEGEEKISKDNDAFKESIKFSTKDGLPKVVKLLINSLKSDKLNTSGLVESVDMNEVINFLQFHLSDIHTFEDMVNKLEELQGRKSYIGDILSKIKGTDVNDSFDKVQVLQGEFFKQFAKAKYNFQLVTINRDGDIKFVNANEQELRNKILAKWRSNFKTSNAVKMSNGRYVADTSKLKGINTKTVEGKIEFFKQLGIDIKTKIPVRTAEYKKFFENLKVLADLILSKNDISDLFDRNKVDSSRWNLIVDNEILNNFDIVELQHINVEGETVYGISLNSFYLYNVAELAKGVLPEHLMNDVYSKNSIIRKRLQEGTLRIKNAVLEGFKQELGDGNPTSKLSNSDLSILIFNSILNNKYPFLRASDKKTENGFELDRPLVTDLQDTLEYLTKALEDEVNWVLMMQSSNESYKLIGKPELTFFKNIIGDKLTFSELKKGVGKNGFNETIRKRLNSIFTEYLENKINDNVKFLNSQDVITISNDTYVLNAVSDNVLSRYDIQGGKVVSSQIGRKIIADFTYNYIVSQIEQTKLFTGNLQYYKNVVNLYKRTSAFTGTKILARTDAEYNSWLAKNYPDNYTNTSYNTRVYDGYERVIVFEDVQAVNEELAKIYPEYAGLEKSEVKGYTESDAQGVITLPAYRELLLRSGLWDKHIEVAYNKAIKGEILTTEEQSTLIKPSLLNAQKPQHSGAQESELGYVPTFYKFSIYPLLPAAIKGTNLEKLNNELLLNGVGISVFESGSKVANKNEIIKDKNGNEVLKKQSFYNDKGQIADINKNLISTVNYINLGIQVENKPVAKTKVITGTQYRAVVQSNIYSEGKPKSEKLANLSKELDDTFNKLTLLARTKLLKEIGAEEVGDYFKFSDNGKKLIEFIKKESIRRNYPRNYMIGLELLVDSENKIIEKLVFKNKIENVINALVNNNVIKQKTNGSMSVQAASTGWETVRASYQDGTNSKWTAETLGFYKNTETGTTAMEVYLPNYFKKYFGNNSDISQIDPRLLELVGFRIPTEQLNSIEGIKVVGFLPEEAGNIVIVPSEIVVKAGSDFDIDKLTLFIPNIKKNDIQLDIDDLVEELKERGYQIEITDYEQAVEDIKNLYKEAFENFNDSSELAKDIKKIIDKFNKDNLYNKATYFEDDSKEGLQNKVIRLSREIILDSSNFDNLIRPNSTADLKAIKSEINKKQETNNKQLGFDTIADFEFNVNLANAYWRGKDLVGIFALHNKNHILAQKANLQFADDSMQLLFKGFENQKNISLSREVALNEKGENSNEIITSSTGQLISASTDVAKEPDILSDLNISDKTADVIAFLLRAGVPKKTVFNFVTQPIIKDYVNRLINSQSVYKVNKVYKDTIIASFNPINNAELLDLNTLIKNQRVVENKQYTELDRKILGDFIRYEEYGKSLSDLQKVLRVDTTGIGKNKTQANLIKYKLEKMLESGMFTNLDKLLNDTYLSEFYKTVVKAPSIYNNLFITAKVPELKQLFNDIFYKRLEIVESEKDLIEFGTILENDIVLYLLQNIQFNNGLSIGSQAENLLSGDKNVAKRLEDYIKAYPNDIISKNVLSTLIDRDKVLYNGLTMNNVRAFTKKLVTFESNIITEGFEEMYAKNPTLTNSLFALSILQGGFNNSPYNYYDLFPQRLVNNFLNSIFDNYLANKDSYDLKDFERKFYLNNTNIKTIVPRIDAFQLDYNSGKKYVRKKQFAKKGQPFPFLSDSRKIKETGEIVQRVYEIVVDTNGKPIKDDKDRYTYRETYKLDDGYWLKQYFGNKSIIPTNNGEKTDVKIEQPKEKLFSNLSIETLERVKKAAAFISSNKDLTEQDKVYLLTKLKTINSEEAFNNFVTEVKNKCKII